MAIRRSVTGSRSANTSVAAFRSSVGSSASSREQCSADPFFSSESSSRKDEDRSSDLIRLPSCCFRKTLASQATAQECVRERAAMVETIRAYARWETGALPRGLSESVLEAVAKTERHRFIPGRSCSVAYRDGPLPIG